MRRKKDKPLSDSVRTLSGYLSNVFYVLFGCLSLTGCSGEASPELPPKGNFPVHYTLDLMGEGYGLQEPFSMMTVTQSRHLGDFLGAGGLLVTHTHAIGGEGDAFAAFDLACPYEWPSVVPIRIKEQGLMEAVCPKCGTVYELSLGAGLPKDGKGRYPLWQYDVALRGTVLEITNGSIMQR